MKPVFRCEYCARIGVEEDIATHEKECIHNHDRKSCLTCKYRNRKCITNVTCTLGKDVPAGMCIEYCDSYEWDEIDHTTNNIVDANSIFGRMFT